MDTTSAPGRMHPATMVTPAALAPADRNAIVAAALALEAAQAAEIDAADRWCGDRVDDGPSFAALTETAGAVLNARVELSSAIRAALGRAPS